MLPIKRIATHSKLFKPLLVRTVTIKPTHRTNKSDISRKEQSVELEYVNRAEREALRKMLLALENQKETVNALGNILEANQIVLNDRLASALVNWRCETFGERAPISTRVSIDAGDVETVEHVAARLKKVTQDPHLHHPDIHTP